MAERKERRKDEDSRINLHGHDPEDVIREVMKVKPPEHEGDKVVIRERKGIYETEEK